MVRVDAGTRKANEVMEQLYRIAERTERDYTAALVPGSPMYQCGAAESIIERHAQDVDALLGKLSKKEAGDVVSTYRSLLLRWLDYVGTIGEDAFTGANPKKVVLAADKFTEAERHGIWAAYFDLSLRDDMRLLEWVDLVLERKAGNPTNGREGMLRGP